MGRWDRRNFGKAGGFVGNDCEDEEGKEDVTHMYYTIKCISNYKCTRTENSYIHDDMFLRPRE